MIQFRIHSSGLKGSNLQIIRVFLASSALLVLRVISFLVLGISPHCSCSCITKYRSGVLGWITLRTQIAPHCLWNSGADPGLAVPESPGARNKLYFGHCSQVKCEIEPSQYDFRGGASTLTRSMCQIAEECSHGRDVLHVDVNASTSHKISFQKMALMQQCTMFRIFTWRGCQWLGSEGVQESRDWLTRPQHYLRSQQDTR